MCSLAVSTLDSPAADLRSNPGSDIGPGIARAKF